MKRNLSLVLLLVAMAVLAACRPAADPGNTSPPAPAATEELGICPPGGDDCEEEEETGAAAEATAPPTAVPTEDKQTADPTPVSAEPVDDPLAVRDTDWVKGAEDPVITLIEYTDYFCPHCATIASSIDHLLDAFPEDIQFVHRHFPLNGDPNSRNQLAVRAAEAAGMQGDFFEYHLLLMERQSELSPLQGDDLRAKYIEYAAELGLDPDQFETDLDSPETAALASAAYEESVSMGLRGTPTIFVNGQQLNPQALTAPDEQWASFIEQQELIRDLPSYDRPEMTIDPQKDYSAIVETEKGTFTIELYADVAPVTVNSFIFLVNQGWYDGVTFHRVLDGFVAQTGDPTGTGAGGPGYTFENEIDPDLTFDSAGLVAMANAGPDTNGSQWFITYAPVEQLNGNYTIFGKVIDGMDVVNSLTRRDPQTNPDFEGDRIVSITIEERS
jgi:cyclophilin family peptidyl-prolyl cis-trans isomerase/protein-disulfide isomerase